MLLVLLLTFMFNAPLLQFFYNKLANYQSNEPKRTSGFDQLLISNGIETKIFYFGVKIVVGIVILAVILFLFLKFKQKLFSFVSGILEELLSIFKMKQKGIFILYSMGIWICYSLPLTLFV